MKNLKYYKLFMIDLVVSILCGITAILYFITYTETLNIHKLIAGVLWTVSTTIWFIMTFTAGLNFVKSEKSWDEWKKAHNNVK